MSEKSCKVEVAANRLGGIGALDYHHLFILFTASDGTQTGLRGGPSGNGDFGSSQSSGSSGSSPELSGGSSHSGSASSSDRASSGSSGSGSNSSSSTDGEDGGPYGYIKTQYGAYTPEFVDYEEKVPTVTICEGPGACALLTHMKNEIDAIGASKVRYSPLGPNSNSTVYTVLRNVGLEPDVPKGVWAPGARTHIGITSDARKTFPHTEITPVCVPCENDNSSK